MRVLVTVEPDTAAGNPPAPVAADPRLFAVLLVHAGEVVSVDRRGDVLWVVTCLPIRQARCTTWSRGFNSRSIRPVPATPSESSLGRPGTCSRRTPGAVDASRLKRLVHVARARTRCQQKPRTY
jgi:hypothetical protein